MPFFRAALTVVICALVVTGCHRAGFDPRAYDSVDALYSASVQQFESRKWSNAARGFERLTTELPARDPRLASVYFFLGSAQQRMNEHLTAAQTFRRVSESFPDDTLADDALFQAGKSYSTLWRKPALDSEHGRSAMNVYQTLVVMYPGSPLMEETQREIDRLEQMFATKDYEAGYHYFRLRAYDSAIIYFTDVIEKYSNTARARDAYMRLLESYRAIRYNEDARELCARMVARYPGDGEVARECASIA